MIPICHDCVNYLDGLKCSAFPEGIPEVILNGENDHSEPIKNQGNDIVFESETENKE